MKKYVDDFETKIKEDEEGKEIKEVVYTGEYFQLSVNETELKKFKRNSLLLVGATILLHVGAGFVGNQGMFTFYVSLPYVFVFLSLYFTALGILRLPQKAQNLRRDEIGLSFDRMRTAGKFLLVLLAATVLGEIVYLIFFSSGGLVRESLFLILEVFAGAAAFVLFHTQKTIKVQKRDKK